MKKQDVIHEGEAITEGLERFVDLELAGMVQRKESPVSETEEIQTQQGTSGLVYRTSLKDEQNMTDNRLEEMQTDDREQPAAPRSSAGKRKSNPQKKRQSHVRSSDRESSGYERERRRSGHEGRKQMKKKKSGMKRFLFLLVFLLVLFGGMWYLAVGRVYKQMNFEKVDELSKLPLKEEGVINILLIGNDSRSAGEDGRSDAMILLSISNKTKKVYMTSLLRDMYVDIPGHDGNRLNAAYAYGGPTLLLETIKQNFDIEINRYVLVNFQAFANLVDAVGGVDLELSNEEVKWVNAYLNEYNLLEGRDITTDYLDESLSGMIHLNGPQALAYCRNRYIGTDFERTNRQRKVLTAVSGKLPVTLATNSNELIEGLFPQLTTNLTQSECYSLSLQASKLLTYEIVQASIPVEGSYQNAKIRKMDVLEVDFEKNKQYIRQNIYGEE